MIPLRLIVIGRKLTEDLLFWQQLGRSIKATPEAPTVLLHGPGEMTALSLEGDGLSLDDAGRDAGRDAAILAAFRNENRRAATVLTEEGVPAVGFLGTDRDMIGGLPGALRVRTGLIGQTAATGAIPLLGAISRGPERIHLPDLAMVLEGWVEGFTQAPGPGGDQRSVPPTIIWLARKSPDPSISAEDVMNRTGEARLPNATKMEGVSVRVSGLSDVGSWPLNTGIALPAL